MYVLLGGILIDGTGSEPVQDAVILIDGKTIKDVGPRSQVPLPESCQAIDITGKTILPGLMDLHVHLYIGEQDIIMPSSSLPAALGQPLTYVGIKGFAYARRALEMGFTTLRDAGDIGYLTVALRNAVNEGLVEGPRIIAAGQWISTTGGHADYLPLWIQRTDDPSNVADGMEGVLKAVRRQIKMKTDWIKFYVTGGIMDPEDKQEFTYEELKSGIDEAHNKEKLVMGHCMYAKGALAGVKAGLDTIEHGTDLNQEIIELMIKNGTFLIPTLSVGRFIYEGGTEFGLPQVYVEKYGPLLDKWRENFQMALEAGVRIALGTDAGFNAMLHGENGKELETMVTYGMTPMQALISATREAAAALRMDDNLGTIEKEKLADIIVVDGNPLSDITLFQKKENILLVIKEGSIYFNRLKPLSLLNI